MRARLLAAAAALLAPAAALLLLPAGPAARAEDEAPWSEAPLKLEAALEPKFRTPRDGIKGSTLRGNWREVSDGKLPFRGVKGGPMRFEPHPSVVKADLDGDGTLETQQKQDRYTVKAAYDDGITATYAFRLRREYEKWFFQTTCLVAGQIDGVKLAFIDYDHDGRYDTIGEDVVRIGGAPGAGFLGRLLPVKDKLYEVEVHPSGTKLRYRPWSDEAGTGTLDLHSGFKAAVKPAIAVVKKVGSPPGAFFQCAVKGGVPVPAGDYELHYAIAGPTRDQVGLVKKGRMAEISVAAGERVAPEWGCPGTIEFKLKKQGSKVEVEDVEFYGRAGEHFEKFEPRGGATKCEVVDAATRRRIWLGNVEQVNRTRLATDAPYLVRLTNEDIPYLGPFASEWR